MSYEPLASLKSLEADLWEASDQSQEWPDLHAAIRATRKAYQADGTMPDWNTFDGMLGEVRRQAQAGQA